MKRFLNNGVTAHRGDSAHCPENTMSAFERGLACGADWLELDVHTTRDDKLVVCHDHTTGRTGSADLVIAESAFADLADIDMASAFRAARDSDVPFARIPLLSEVLERVMSQSRCRVSIQPKSDCVPNVVRLIEDMGGQAWVGFNDGDLNKLIETRRRLPQVPIFYDTGPGLESVDAVVETALTNSFQAVMMHKSTVTRDAVDIIAAAGLVPGAWTVNDPEEMRRLLNLGVFRFYTDDPECLLRLCHAARMKTR